MELTRRLRGMHHCSQADTISALNKNFPNPKLTEPTTISTLLLTSAKTMLRVIVRERLLMRTALSLTKVPRTLD